MTQLRQEGWIHHLARHAVACFLTRGDLWISWEEGQKVRKMRLHLDINIALYQDYEMRKLKKIGGWVVRKM